MGNLARTPRADSASTRQRILDASERLFGERGYSGTSLRAIADQAGVNLAAANYHFGSKAQLLEASFQRSVAPVNAERIRRLDELEDQPALLTVEAVVRAFVEPGLKLATTGSVPRLMARIFAEPKEVAIPLLERTFGSTGQRFIAALEQALPTVERSALIWRFHFLVGCLIHLNNIDAPLSVFEVGAPPEVEPTEVGPDQLIEFAVAGICQGVSS